MGVLFRDFILSGISTGTGIFAGSTVFVYMTNSYPDVPNFILNLAAVYWAPFMGGAISSALCEGIVGKKIGEFSYECFLLKRKIKDLQEVSEIFKIFGSLKDIFHDEKTLKFRLGSQLGHAALFFSSTSANSSETHIFAYQSKGDRIIETVETKKLASSLSSFIRGFLGGAETCDPQFYNEAKNFAFSEHKDMELSMRLPSKKRIVTMGILIVVSSLLAYSHEPIVAFCDAHPWLAAPLITARAPVYWEKHHEYFQMFFISLFIISSSLICTSAAEAFRD